MFDFKGFIKNYKPIYYNFISCKSCGKCRTHIHYYEDINILQNNQMHFNKIKDLEIYYFFKMGLFSDSLIIVGNLNNVNLNEKINDLNVKESCVFNKFLYNLKLNHYYKPYLNNILKHINNLHFIESCDIISNEIIINMNFKPKFYIKNKENEPNTVNLKEIPENIANSGIIKNIKLYFDENLKITDLKIKQFHPNADINGSFCLGNYRFSDLTIENIKFIFDLLGIYNLNNRHFDVKGL